ncbi:hypothetical protein ABZ399_30105 [Micromonospora aurantiaca]|uniref:hypothetical protein n=1 Tax=Micromonospora TaxID=1873 RepID=UPI0004C15CDD|nr:MULTISPECIES: hypothetical protein [Micromonospora]OHX01279.1 hypothetical protein BFV98_00040 [Micromonospora sp. WMMB235]OHX01497.1 hypothetical protein BFV98_00090 [Micromonospora sp. WMMB235]OHX07106.1 hypothetical protein BFV98_31265 [Micromonospora sp. WMMB235]
MDHARHPLGAVWELRDQVQSEAATASEPRTWHRASSVNPGTGLRDRDRDRRSQYLACGADLGITSGAYNWQLYQPGTRYWLFQGIETGIFVAVAALLLYLAIRRIRRVA